MKKLDDKIVVAKIGKVFGIRGELLLHVLSDFPQSIKSGSTYFYERGELVIKSFDRSKSIVSFEKIDNREEARLLTNCHLYTTKDDTANTCILGKDEYFWFDIIGSSVYEDNILLGIVDDIDRFGGGDFLCVKTDMNLVAQGMPKQFLIPYTDRYIVNVENTNPKSIFVQFCKDILENS